VAARHFGDEARGAAMPWLAIFILRRRCLLMCWFIFAGSGRLQE
jgi:hypothetical protein